MMLKQALIDSFNEDLKKVYANDSVKPVFAPFETLGKEIIDHLPSLDGSILVLSDCGLLIALLLNNRTADITFVAHTERQAEFARQVSVTKIIQIGYNDPIKELEKHLMGLKFDIIVGNPPYQPSISGGEERAGSANSIWHKFSEISFNHLNDDGFLAFITPPQWRIPTLATKRDNYAVVREFMAENHIIYLMTGAEKFFNLTIGIDAYVLKKRPATTSTTIRFFKHGDLTKELDLKRVVLPIKADDTTLSIISKISAHEGEKIKLVPSPGGFCIGKRYEHVSLERTSSFKYPMLANIFGGAVETGKVAWTDIAHPHQTSLKVLVPMDGRYVSFPFERGIYGLGIGVLCIPVNSIRAGEALASFLNSKVIKFFITSYQDRDQFKFPAYALQLLPFLNSKKWTDAELYTHFKLTQEEIDLIETTIK